MQTRPDCALVFMDAFCILGRIATGLDCPVDVPAGRMSVCVWGALPHSMHTLTLTVGPCAPVCHTRCNSSHTPCSTCFLCGGGDVGGAGCCSRVGACDDCSKDVEVGHALVGTCIAAAIGRDHCVSVQSPERCSVVRQASYSPALALIQHVVSTPGSTAFFPVGPVRGMSLRWHVPLDTRTEKMHLQGNGMHTHGPEDSHGRRGCSPAGQCQQMQTRCNLMGS